MAEADWIRAYGRELDRTKRKALLDEGMEAEGITSANEMRQKLFAARYIEEKGNEVDTFLRGWMGLTFLRGSGRRFLGRRSAEKEKAAIRRDFQLELAKEYGETGEQVLYEEFCNAARLYLALSREDKNYSSVLFGLGRMKEENLTNKLAKDFSSVAFEIPVKLGMEEELGSFRRALVDVFTETFPGKQSLLTGRETG